MEKVEAEVEAEVDQTPKVQSYAGILPSPAHAELVISASSYTPLPIAAAREEATLAIQAISTAAAYLLLVTVC